MASPILGLGLFNSIYYYLPRSSNNFRLMTKALGIVLVTSVIFGLILSFGGMSILVESFNNPELFEFLPILVPYTFFSLSTPLVNAYFIHLDRTKLLSTFNSVFSITLLIVTIVVLYIFNSLFLVLLLRVLFYALFITVMVIVGYKLINKKENNTESQSMPSVFSILKYSIPLGLASVIGIISMKLDKLIVSIYFNPDVFGIYSNGAMEIPFIGLVTGSLTMVSISELSKLCKDKNFVKAITLFKRIAIISSYFLFPSMIFFMIYAQDFILFLFGEKFRESYIPFTIYLFLLPIRIIIYGPVLIALGKPTVILIRSIVELIINVILSLILLQYLGYNGVALATVLSVLVWSVPFNLHSISMGFQERIKGLLPYTKLLKIFGASLLPAVPLIFIRYFTQYNSMFFFLIGGAVYTTGVIALFGKLNYIAIEQIKEMVLPKRRQFSMKWFFYLPLLTACFTWFILWKKKLYRHPLNLIVWLYTISAVASLFYSSMIIQEFIYIEKLKPWHFLLYSF